MGDPLMKRDLSKILQIINGKKYSWCSLYCSCLSSYGSPQKQGTIGNIIRIWIATQAITKMYSPVTSAIHSTASNANNNKNQPHSKCM